MLVLVTYDVAFDDASAQRRLRRLAKVCLDFGVRAQYSVFECDIDPAQWVAFKEQLFEIYDPKVDSLRFYKLGKNWRNKVEHHGAKPVFDVFRDHLIV